MKKIVLSLLTVILISCNKTEKSPELSISYQKIELKNG